MADMKDPATGIAFAPTLKTWSGGILTGIGAGARVVKVAFVSVKVYGLAMYVDAGAVRGQGLAAVNRPGTARAIFMELARNVSGKEYVNALDKSIGPRMTAEPATMEAFRKYFLGRNLVQGTRIVMASLPAGDACAMHVKLIMTSPGSPLVSDLSSAEGGDNPPTLVLDSPLLCDALYANYLDPATTVTPSALDAWTKGVKTL